MEYNQKQRKTDSEMKPRATETAQQQHPPGSRDEARLNPFRSALPIWGQMAWN